MKTLWKSMLTGPRSANGSREIWKVGEWRKCEGELKICQSGYHASKNVIDAMNYVNAEVIARVEVRGKHIDQDDKQCWEEMRVVKAWPWTKKDSVSLAIYAAELVIGIFEKRYPDDKRPRLAIEAAKRWLNEPSEENRQAATRAAGAAGAARSAWAARSAEVAAWVAAGAARAAGAAGAAEAAAGAARAAWAARAAAGAARAAAEAAVKAKCHKFVLARLAAKEKGDD
jgi:hypothetical protein